MPARKKWTSTQLWQKNWKRWKTAATTSAFGRWGLLETQSALMRNLGSVLLYAHLSMLCCLGFSTLWWGPHHLNCLVVALNILWACTIIYIVYIKEVHSRVHIDNFSQELKLYPVGLPCWSSGWESTSKAGDTLESLVGELRSPYWEAIGEPTHHNEDTAQPQNHILFTSPLSLSYDG